MKIALITDGIYPFVLGGMQKHSYYIAKYFARLGHHIIVFHCPPNDAVLAYNEYFTDKELENLTFFEIPFPDTHTKPGHYIRNSELYSEAIRTQLMTIEDIDFIYTKGFTGISLFKHKKDFKAPIAVQLHGLEMFQKGGNIKQWLEKILLKKPAKYCLNNADVIFTYGGKIWDIIEEQNTNQATIIKQQGAADDFWLQTENTSRSFDNTFTFVGRFEHRKGLHLLHEIIPKIKEQFVLNIVGAVPDEAKIDDARIHYHGNKSAEDIFSLLRNSTFLLVPSLAEGFPTIIVEAMAQGVIPIATNVGAIAEIINNQNGLLFEANNGNLLLQTIEKALSLPKQERKVLSENARKTVLNHYNWDTTAAKLAEEIEQICDNRKRTDS